MPTDPAAALDHATHAVPGASGAAAAPEAAVAAAARRAALDHVLALIADAPWSAEVVLRGSRVLAAWYGERAREAADLDFVVQPSLIPPLDEAHPYPHLDTVEDIQHWPEAADGAARYDLWKDGEEEHEPGGFHPRTAPEGLAWITRPEPAGQPPVIEYLRERIAEHPEAAPGVLLDADGVHGDGSWGYAYDPDPFEAPCDENDSGATGSRGVRILVPWRAPDGSAGEVQLDFAHDERMPEPAVWTLIPAPHRAGPLVVRTASRRVSLAWKLLWLYRDADAEASAPQCKDLYDAVLLAEDPHTGLNARLLRRVVRNGRRPHGLRLDDLGPDEAAWAAFQARHPWVRGPVGQWLDRLAAALEPVAGDVTGDASAHRVR